MARELLFQCRWIPASLKFAVAALVLALSAGCAEQASIYHLRSIAPGEASALTVDADQRSTYFTRSSSGIRLCAEAAPDAFSAFSASASGDLGLEGIGGPTVNARARAAMAIAESAGTIERTQTINLLRESMYRTCERYLSGAIDETSFIVQAARDQRSMVAVLAIEQLTRAARRPSTVLAPPATGASVLNGEQAAELLVQLNTERKAADSAVATALADYQAKTATGKCDTVTTAPAATATTAPTLTDWTACVAAKGILDQRRTEAQAAARRFDNALQASGAMSVNTSATTGAGTSTAGADSGTPLTGAELTALSDAVVRIANAPAINEAMMFCIASLSPGTAVRTTADPSVRTLCLDVLRTRAEAELRLLSFVEDPAGNLIINYMAEPADPAERSRRRQLVSSVMGGLHLPSDGPPMLDYLVTAAPATKSSVLARLRTIETDAAGQQALAVH
jgi:hypothetical protein